MPEMKKIDVEKPSHPIRSGSLVNIIHFENFNSIFIRSASFDSVENFSTFCKQMLKFYRIGLLNHNMSNNDHKNVF